MKNTISFIFLLFFSMQTYSQNSAIFTGGNADGWAMGVYAQPTNNIFTGGIGDGWSKGIYAQPENNIFTGGKGDGWAEKDTSYQLVVSIIENKFTASFNAFPNPTTGAIEILLGADAELLIASICDANGKLIEEQQSVNTNHLRLFIDGKPGIYFVKVRADGGIATLKILKH